MGALLIDCEACSKQYSKKAQACPQCGNPTELKMAADSKNPVTVEQTSKKYKAGVLIGWSMIIAGFVFMGIAPVFGTTIASCGAICLIYSRFGAWWNNG